jgi:hypothetical protein
MMEFVRWATVGLLAATMALTPVTSQAADFHYFRMYGSGSQIPGGPTAPPQGVLTLAFSGASTASIGDSYSAVPQVVGAVGAPSFSIMSGALPDGLSLNPSSGAISGTLTAQGTFDAVVRVTDAANAFGAARFYLTVSPELSAGWVAATGKVGAIYAANPPIIAGGRAPYVFSLTGSAPAGLVFSQTDGRLTGTPTQEGSYSLSVTVVDADGRSASTGIKTVTISPADIIPPTGPALALGGTPGTAAQVGVGYVSHFTASGGTSPYVFDIAAGTLPSGLTLASDGTISGAPVSAGTSSGLQIRVTDAASATAISGAFSITVSPQPALLISGIPSATARVGQTYVAEFTAFDGSGSGYAFTLSGNPLPAGLTLSTVGSTNAQISGLPTQVGTYSGLQVRVTDSQGHAADSQTFTIVVAPAAGPALAISGSPSAHAMIGSVYADGYSASGGNGDYVFSITSGSLPTGLGLSGATGGISGTPTQAGTATFTVSVSDAQGQSVSAPQATITTVPAMTQPSGAYASSGIHGAPYSSGPLSVSGGNAPLSWELVSGNLPPPLVLNGGSGVISGTPNTSGSFTFTVKAVDAAGFSSPVSASQNIVVTTTPDPVGSYASAATQYASYSSAPLTHATGGTEPYTWSVNSGALPSGIVLDPSTGGLSGVPITSGTFNFAVVLTDANGIAGPASAGQTITVAAATATASMTGGKTAYRSGNSISGTLSSSLPSPAWTFSQTPATPSLSFEGSGASFSGTAPTVASLTNYSSVVATATSGGHSVSAAPLNLSVAPPLTILSGPSGSLSGTVNTAFSAALHVSGMAGTPSYVLLQNDTPFTGIAAACPGLSFSGGQISGTPTGTCSIANLSIAATDDYDGASVVSLSFSISTGNPISTPSGSFTAAAIQGASYSSGPLTVSGDNGTITWSLATGTLPPGLVLDPASGIVSGVPTGTGQYDFAVKVTAGNGMSAASGIKTIKVGSTPGLAGNYPNTTTQFASYAGAALTISPSGTNTGGTLPYTWDYAGGGQLPAGLTVNPSTGVLSGSPTQSGTFNFYVRLTDANGVVGPVSTLQTISVTAADATASLTGNKTAYRVGNVIGGSLTTNLVSSAWSFDITSTPSGASLTLVPSGPATSSTFSGTAPSVSESTSFTIVAKATTAGGSKSAAPLNISVRPPVTVSGGPSGTASGSNSANYTSPAISLNNLIGTAVYALRQSGTNYTTLSTDCPGLSFSGTTGLISGLPSGNCTVPNLTIVGFDSYDNSSAATSAFSLSMAVVQPVSVAATTSSFASLVNGGSFSTSAMTASGGTGNFVSAAVNSTTVKGLTATVSGSTVTVSGTPIVQGDSASYTVTVTDAAGPIGTSGTVSMTFQASPLVNTGGSYPTTCYIGETTMGVPASGTASTCSNGTFSVAQTLSSTTYMQLEYPKTQRLQNTAGCQGSCTPSTTVVRAWWWDGAAWQAFPNTGVREAPIGSQRWTNKVLLQTVSGTIASRFFYGY